MNSHIVQNSHLAFLSLAEYWYWKLLHDPRYLSLDNCEADEIAMLLLIASGVANGAQLIAPK
jgi:hypothetical protein